jgi:phosphomannomutase
MGLAKAGCRAAGSTLAGMDLDAIFKAYDVRGLVPGQLDEEAARRIGIGFAEFSGETRIALGYDCRVSSPGLAAAFAAGVNSRGVTVIDIGQITTDALYYVCGAFDMAGVVITASHNPAEWNGIKFCLPGAAPVGQDDGLSDIKAIAADPPDDARPRGGIEQRDILDGYVDHLFSVVDTSQFAELRVAVDAGNGMAGIALPAVFDRIPATLDGLYLEPDGTFPNHPADPLQAENLADLLDRMADHPADLGVAFDGDADRAFFIDDMGVPLSGSTTTALIADWFLDKNEGATVVHNLICSKAVPETVAAAGGTPVRTRVGHSFIKQVMKDTGAVFGGEHSGHYYFADNFRADSGILAMLVLLQVLSEAGRPLSELRRDYEPYAASGEINYDVADHGAALAAVEAAFPGAAMDHLDGLTVDLGDRWFNLRPSNTEPKLRLNAEAPDAAGVDQLVEEVATIITERT